MKITKGIVMVLSHLNPPIFAAMAINFGHRNKIVLAIIFAASALILALGNASVEYLDKKSIESMRKHVQRVRDIIYEHARRPRGRS